MIIFKDNYFHIKTQSTSYIFRVNSHRDLEHLYYGQSILADDLDTLLQSRSVLLVSALYENDDITYGIDDMCFEYSFSHRGDNRYVAFEADGDPNYIYSFKYSGYEIDAKPINDIEQARSYNYDKSLKIVMEDENGQATINLWYLVFEESNVITRFVEIVNHSTAMRINSIMSGQIDFDDTNYKVLTFNGAWGRERYKQEQSLNLGRYVCESNLGTSSTIHNPFTILSSNEANNHSGDSYGFNLIYSGNHSTSYEINSYGKTRVIVGINPHSFSYTLNSGEKFTTPEMVMTYSNKGYNGISRNMHRFVNNNIIRGYWKYKAKPVLVNSWEAMYFDITESKILKLADKALEIGAEMIVVDDGWFGNRNDDKTSLGDMFVSKKKFPNGLSSIVETLHHKGLKFGLWFEPEMISEDSSLYQSHPEYALKVANISNVIGRSQLLINLTMKEVRDYIVDSMTEIINSNKIDYIKWDYNRTLSDVCSNSFVNSEMQYRYILGLYDIYYRITNNCPEVLFEFCASGGNRYDLGMMCYSPIGWVSDNTDFYARSLIQEGTSYGYPQSTMCNHISIVPNHQTKRLSSMDSRARLASVGVLGLQYDLTQLEDSELEVLSNTIKEYKMNRELYQYGKFTRLIDTFSSNYGAWQIMQGSRGKIVVTHKLFEPVTPTLRLKLYDLESQSTYKISNKDYSIVASGEILMKAGFILPQNYQGNELTNMTRVMIDFTAVEYDIELISFKQN